MALLSLFLIFVGIGTIAQDLIILGVIIFFAGFLTMLKGVSKEDLNA